MEKVGGHQHPWCSLAQDPWEELVGGFHKWRCPIAGWFLLEHVLYEVDDFGGTAILGNL